MSSITSAKICTVPASGRSAPPKGHALRLDIQGLRAVAVGLVVLSHAGVSQVSGGYIGVDVFFVISGFLITSLLLRELATTGRVSVRSFYARRALRLLPASSLVIVPVTACATHRTSARSPTRPRHWTPGDGIRGSRHRRDRRLERPRHF
ncbi:Acyltransferase family protein [Streptomyces sp. Ncost-T10-10d]|nr:Acyltransferase family protein [Streptomyces sp. Ncost-T10-10d]